MTTIRSHITDLRFTLLAVLVAVVASLALSAVPAQAASVPYGAVIECNNAGGGCYVRYLPGGCHVYHGGYYGRIYAHNRACGYGTRSYGGYTDYLGSF